MVISIPATAAEEPNEDDNDDTTEEPNEDDDDDTTEEPSEDDGDATDYDSIDSSDTSEDSRRLFTCDCSGNSSEEDPGVGSDRPLPRRGSRERRPARLFQYDDLL